MPARLPARPGPIAAPALIAILAFGCSEPREVIPVAPPGVELVRVPAVPVGEPVALGEKPGPEGPQGKVEVDDQGAEPTPIGQPKTLPSGLIYETLKEGTGAVAHRGNGVEVHYTGTLADGTVFDSSRGKDSFKRVIGRSQVIPGWDQGIPGMKVGERRKLVIPPALGYGQRGTDGIPGGATLTFDVELIAVN